MTNDISVTISGGVNRRLIETVRSIDSDATLNNFDLALVDASSNSVAVTLPSPDKNVRVIIKVTDASNTVTVDTPNNETIDGQNNRTINGHYISRTIVSDGSNYYIV